MAKKEIEENLFNLDMETQDIKLPGEDFVLQVPSAKMTQPGQKPATGKNDAPPIIRDTMLQGGEMPPLIVVDVEPGDNIQTGILSATPRVETKTITETETKPVAEKEIISPAEKTEEKTPPATQGQQGEPGKDIESEEKLSPTYLHAAALHEAGVLPNLDLETLKELEPGDILDKLIEANRDEVKDQAQVEINAYKNQFNADQRKVLDMIEEGVIFDDATNTVYNQLRYDTINETQIKESPDIQEQLYREFLYAKGHNDSYINRAVKQSKDLENLETDGLAAHTELKTMLKEEEEVLREEAKLQSATRKQKTEDNIKRIKTDVIATKEILSGIELSKIDKDKIIEYMTVPAAEILQNGQKIPISKMEEVRRANPIEFNKRMAYFVHLGLFGDNPKLDKIEKQGETNAVNRLKDVLVGSTTSGGGKAVISDKDTKTIQGKETEPEFRMPRQISTVRHD
jgi:hypothetical protein